MSAPPLYKVTSHREVDLLSYSSTIFVPKSSSLDHGLSGNRGPARACIRHLARFLSPSTEPSSVGTYGKGFTAASERPKLTIPRTPLSKLFLEKDKVGEQVGIHNGKTSFGLLGGAGEGGGNFAENFLSTYSKDSFADFSVPLNSEVWGNGQATEAKGNAEIKSGGLQPFTKLEVESVSKILKESEEVPGLSDANEKIQLLALIDVLAEMDGVSQPSPTESLDYPGQR